MKIFSNYELLFWHHETVRVSCLVATSEPSMFVLLLFCVFLYFCLQLPLSSSPLCLSFFPTYYKKKILAYTYAHKYTRHVCSTPLQLLFSDLSQYIYIYIYCIVLAFNRGLRPSHRQRYLHSSVSAQTREARWCVVCCILSTVSLLRFLVAVWGFQLLFCVCWKERET